LDEIELDKVKSKLQKLYTAIPNYYYFDLPDDDVIIAYKGIISSEYSLTSISNAQKGDCYFLANDSSDGANLKGDIYIYIADSSGALTWTKINYNDNKLYWLRDAYERPASLNFWFDFLDTEG
jgi:hypothetical protein